MSQSAISLDYTEKDEFPKCSACDGSGIEVFGDEPMQSMVCEWCDGDGHIDCMKKGGTWK